MSFADRAQFSISNFHCHIFSWQIEHNFQVENSMPHLSFPYFPLILHPTSLLKDQWILKSLEKDFLVEIGHEIQFDLT